MIVKTKLIQGAWLLSQVFITENTDNSFEKR